MIHESVKIDVRIPYEPGGRLGWDYNRIMRESVYEWVLVIDHDVILGLNPHWYQICQKTIENQSFGVATCRTNADHKNTGQTWKTSANTFEEHQTVAKEVWDKFQYGVTDLDKASGFFMLISKQWWRKVGGFPGRGMFQEDWLFTRNIKKHGGRVIRIDGLYVYHAKNRIPSWIEGEMITNDYRLAHRNVK